MICGRLLPFTNLPSINIPDSNDGWDLAALAIIGLLALFGWLVKEMLQVRTQVKNKHKTNLRDDVDVGNATAARAEAAAAKAEAASIQAQASSYAAKVASEATLSLSEALHSEMLALRRDMNRGLGSIQQSVGAEP